MYKKYLLLFVAVPLLLNAAAQKTSPKKYPSLLWEITGNGLKKPSYLFGTMHVSSKMAFHLSDSFYYAIKNADAVALELNPDIWQGQMVRMEELKTNYTRYAAPQNSDYLTENSFRIKKYDDDLKLALSTEPTVVNSLLYRSYKAKEDFEEDTFLDLYIFQTGRKLGKRAAGVENYYETEKIVLQAYADMATEKKKKTIDTDGESMRDIVDKIQDAYKRGDLDLMDSLDIMIDQSAAFREKFLYLRNEIQANSMDSIMKKSSLFVGVGSAHLPGNRGVIELLRKKGYKLRPIKMADRDATQKDAVDKLKVPVLFSNIQSEDGFYNVDVPGPLYKVSDDYNTLDRRQFADMNNGVYYQVARVRTHAAFINQAEAVVKKKIDSLLYENIPGKILKKTAIVRNGYTGYDISSKTRRGDLQRYHIFITPFEVLIFKMSGKENYVGGTEANLFFSSISLKEADNNSVSFAPRQGGFAVTLPQRPVEYFNNSNSDGNNRWEYEAVNKTTGDAYTILKQSIYNFNFLEKDSFDLKLMEESFRSPDFFERQLQRCAGNFNSYPCLDVKEKMKDSSIVSVRYIIKGPHYYALAVRSNNENSATDFFKSFHFLPYVYSTPHLFTDTFLHFSAITPVEPLIDTGYRAVLEKMSVDVAANSSVISYWPKKRNAIFYNDSTGEIICTGIQKYPTYFYVSDSSKFWDKEIEKIMEDRSMVLQNKTYFEKPGSVRGYQLTLTDTGSSRTITGVIALKDNYLFNIVTMGDTLNHASSFTTTFFASFLPEQKQLGRNIFVNCLDSFYADLFSKDSAAQARAQQATSNIYFGEKGVPVIMEALKKLSPSVKNYFDTKTKLIAELGFIKDTTQPVVVSNLQQLYRQTADTSMFQNEVIDALARHQTSEAAAAFKELVLQDPPVFDNDYDYNSMFEHFDDSLQLAVPLFPDLLQLTTLDDYKEPVMQLLVKLVDSGYIKPAQYESWFNKIQFDARIALKKQQGKDEKKMEEENNNDENEDIGIRYNNNEHSDELKQYAILLAPFYKQYASVPKFFDKLLQSKDEDVQLNTAIILLKNNQTVADSIFNKLAAKDQFRGKLYTILENIHYTEKFPAGYKTQIDLARSYLVSDKNYNKFDSIAFVAKQLTTFKEKKGFVYFFKYRVKKEDGWKMGLSGLQPENETEVSSNDWLSVMTDKKIKDDKPEAEQFREHLKKLEFNTHPSAKNFYENDGDYSRFRRLLNYDN